MANINIDGIYAASVTLQNRTCYVPGKMHSATRCFNACMRAFDSKGLPAQSITFDIFINAPVMRDGFAEIDREGNLRMWLA